jgi:CBS domain-containing protein
MISIRELLRRKSSTLFTVGPSDLVSDALVLLAKHKIGALLVLEGDKLVGILSERDCAIKVALPGKSAAETRVKDIMTAEVITIDPRLPLEECMSEMNRRDIRHLPVLEDGRVVGMVSIGDVSKEMLTVQGQLIDQLEAYIHRRVSV